MAEDNPEAAIMSLRDDLHHRRDALTAIAARHGATNLRLFGSVARREERHDSDVDILVDMAADRGFGDYLALVEELEDVLARRVDLVTERSLSPHFRPFIEAEAQPL
jgi:predicted nucleotidyltransferase